MITYGLPPPSCRLRAATTQMPTSTARLSATESRRIAVDHEAGGGGVKAIVGCAAPGGGAAGAPGPRSTRASAAAASLRKLGRARDLRGSRRQRPRPAPGRVARLHRFGLAAHALQVLACEGVQGRVAAQEEE